MKKVLSFILCVLMIIGSFTGAITVSAAESNLWTNMTVEDFGTKDTNRCPISGYEESTNNYGKKFTVKGAYYTSFYIEMPELEVNSIYDLSFKYDNHIIANNAGSIRSVYVATEEDLAGITDADGTKLPSTATLIGSSLELDKGEYTELSATYTTGDTKTKHYLYFVTNYAYWLFLCDFKLTKVPTYGVTVEGGTADKITTTEGDTVTITATPTVTQNFSYWEVISGNVTLSDEFSETTTFTMPAEAVSIKAVYTENLWGGIDTTWFGTVDKTLNGNFNCTARDDATFSDALSVNMCWYSTFYIKLPSNLKTNTDYEVTFNYDNSIQKTASKLTRIDIVTEEGLEAADDNGYGTTTFKNLTTNLALDKGGWTEVTVDFKTDDTETEYYLYFTTGYCYRLYLGGFNFTEITKNPITVENGTANVSSAKKNSEITITANEPENGMVFDRFEVVSGNVTLTDPYSATTTFTMGNEAVNIRAVYREYGAKIVYVNTDGTPYADAANLTYAKAEITKNADGTETVTINYDIMDGINSFLGWFNSETLLEKGESYTYNPEETDISNITAKILCRNVLTGAASFEGYENNASMRVEPIATGVAPYDDKWGLFASGKYEQENIGFYLKTSGAKQSTYYTNIGFDRETATTLPEAERTVAKFQVTPHSGNSMLELSASYRCFVRKIDGLKPNTNYTLSMYVLAPDEYNFLSSAVIAGGYTENPGTLKTMSNRVVEKGKVKYYGYYEEPRCEELFETNVRIKDTSAIQNWKKINFNFTTDESTDSMYLYLVPRNYTTWYNRCAIFIDDMVCFENIAPNMGNAMRATSATLPQALRYKFSVKNEMLNSYEGYSFKELGILAADNDKLNSTQLYKGNKNAKDVKVSKENYQYVEGDNENTYFTAALYNIGRSGGKMDYSKFASEYTVRPYFVYTDVNSAEVIIYGEPVTVSVFDVMYAIRDWPKSAEDLNIVNAMLEDSNVLSAYSDWQPADGWNINCANPATEYDYSFAVVGDIQYTTENYPDDLHHTFDWLINNKDAKALQYVFNTGDITNMSSDKEYTAIDAQLQRLKEAGINQTVIRGNHDKIAGYDKHITTEKYAYGGEAFESYDGSMKTYYRIITIGGIKYMMLTLDFFPSTAEVAWAREKVDTNPDCNVIVTTHGYLEDNMTLLQEEDVYDVDDRVDAEGNKLGGHAGQYIYDNLVLPCSNVVMVICGHEFSFGPEYKTITRADGSTAVQLLVDFQQAEYLDLRSYGMISMLYFSNGGKTVTVEWFSSVKNEYYMDKYQFTFELN